MFRVTEEVSRAETYAPGQILVKTNRGMFLRISGGLDKPPKALVKPNATVRAMNIVTKKKANCPVSMIWKTIRPHCNEKYIYPSSDIISHQYTGGSPIIQHLHRRKRIPQQNPK